MEPSCDWCPILILGSAVLVVAAANGTAGETKDRASSEASPGWPPSEGCKNPGIAQAMEAVRAAIPKAAKDPTRPAITSARRHTG